MPFSMPSLVKSDARLSYFHGRTQDARQAAGWHGGQLSAYRHVAWLAHPDPKAEALELEVDGISLVAAGGLRVAAKCEEKQVPRRAAVCVTCVVEEEDTPLTHTQTL